jgi:glycerophosphoryl diester phosphodiesterase
MGRKTKLAIAIAAASAAAWAGSKAILKPQKREDKEVLQSIVPIVLAHRGGAEIAPEHTMVAFEKSYELGVDAFEIDIRLTKDEEIVVFHDETIDRTSDGYGAVKDYTLDELKQFNFGYHFKDSEGNYPYRDEKVEIVTLKELFNQYPNMYINIDIKEHPDTYEGSLMPSKLWRLIEENGAQNRVVVTSFYSEQVDRFNLYAQNQVALGAGESDVKKAFAAYTSQFGHLYHPKVDVFQIPVKSGRVSLDSPKFINYLKKYNIPVHYWVIDDVDTIRRLLDNGAQGIVTGRPDIALPVVKEWIEEHKEKTE